MCPAMRKLTKTNTKTNILAFYVSYIQGPQKNQRRNFIKKSIEITFENSEAHFQKQSTKHISTYNNVEAVTL